MINSFEQTVLDSLTDPLAVLDQHGVIGLVNAAWVQFAWRNGSTQAGMSPVGVNYLSVCESAGGMQNGVEGAAAADGIRAVMDGRRAEFQLDYPCHSPHEQRWFRMTVTRVRGTKPRVVVIHRNITPFKRVEIASNLAQTMLRQAAEEDPLTGLPNRMMLTQRLAKLTAQERGDPPFPWALIFLNLDRYKLVCNALGHETGDGMLVVLAQRLRAAQAAGAFIARFRGDEFVYVASGIDDAQQATELATRLQSALAQPFLIREQPLHSTLSVGIALAGTHSRDPDELLRNGTIALHEAMRAEPGSIRVFEPGMHDRLARHLHAEVRTV